MSAQAGRIALATALAAAFACGVVALRVWPEPILRAVEAAIGTVRDAGAAGWLLLAAAQIAISVAGVLPASLLGIVAGAVYGIGGGFALAAASTLIGAVLSFRLARSLFRDSVARFVGRRPRLAAFDGLVARDGWRSVCLIRLSPVMPFAATSLMLGLSSVRLRDYMLGTLASLPALLGYVCLGNLAGVGLATARGGGGILQWGLLAVGIAATAAITLRIGRMIARAARLDPAVLDAGPLEGAPARRGT